MPSRFRSIASGARAVDVDSHQIVPAGRFTIGGIDDARKQFCCADVGAPLQRDFLHLTAGDQAGPLGAFRLHGGRFAGDRHGFRYRADLQRDRRKRHALRGGNANVALFVFLEAGSVHRQYERSRQQFCKDKAALLVRFRGTRLLGGAICDLYGAFGIAEPLGSVIDPESCPVNPWPNAVVDQHTSNTANRAVSGIGLLNLSNLEAFTFTPFKTTIWLPSISRLNVSDEPKSGC